jgi:hypothetical protein
VELYTLDALWRRVAVIDVWKSLIWTERYKELGDFQLDIVSTPEARNLLKVGTYIAMSDSFYVMRITTTEDDDSADDERILTVKGSSIETLLNDRVAAEYLSDTTAHPNWTITDTPTAVMRKVFHDICVTGTLSTDDIIPFVVEGTFLPTSTITEPIDPITMEIEPTSVYTVIKQIADTYNIGFRLLRYYDSSQLYWDVYTGNDRTSSQTTLPAVIFAPELDNLQNTKELISIDGSANVAYVFSPAGFQVVYPTGVDPDVAGFDRHVIAVNATDVTTETYTTPEEVTAALVQKGNEALAALQTYQAFDGEISQFSRYRYGRDFYLGDIVEQRNDDGVANNMRVTEQIFVSDENGERSYPTLTLNTFITTGSWLSWLPGKVWEDMGADEYWADQP